MNAAVSLMDGLGLDGDRCIRVIPRQYLVGRKKTATVENFNLVSEVCGLNTTCHSAGNSKNAFQ